MNRHFRCYVHEIKAHMPAMRVRAHGEAMESCRRSCQHCCWKRKFSENVFFCRGRLSDTEISTHSSRPWPNFAAVWDAGTDSSYGRMTRASTHPCSLPSRWYCRALAHGTAETKILDVNQTVAKPGLRNVPPPAPHARPVLVERSVRFQVPFCQRRQEGFAREEG